MTKVNSGNDQQALQMGGGGVGFLGTATGITSSTLTMSGATWTTGQWIGRVVVLTGATGAGAYGVVTANTATALTVVRWYNAATPGGTATTVSGTPTFVILPGGAPAYFMGLSTTNSAAGPTDTTMGGEITTSGGGLIRYPAVWTHTTGAASYTLTGTFTANASDTLLVTAFRIGVFTDLTGGIMQFETLLSSGASFNAIGDQAVITHSISN